MNPTITALRAMTRGAYSLQHLRIQCGLRLCANFRQKLQEPEGGEEADEGELSEKAQKIAEKATFAVRPARPPDLD